jgi:hypothetical protein
MDDTTSWLWLEELDAASGRAAWSLAELANAAYDLGAFAAQGVATLEDVQRLPWAAHRWLRGWLDTAGVMGGAHALSHDGCWTHPLIRDRLPASAYAVFAGLMAAADRLLRSTRRVAPDGCSPRLPVEQPVSRDGGPRTSHGRHRLELLRHCTDRAGSRPPHRCQCFLGAVQPSRAEEHAQTATAAYLEGLRAFGWRGASEDVQFAAVAAGALQNLSFAVSHIAWLCPDLGDPDRWPDDLAERQSTDVDAVMDAWCESFRFLMSLGERAMRLVTKD